MILTPMQIRILQMKIAGKPLKEIGSELSMSIGGVDYHLKQAREVNECQSTIELAAKSIFKGIIKETPVEAG